MPDVPSEAVRLALVARIDALNDRPDPMVLSEEALTRIMLEAAAPVLADHIAQKITDHKYEHEPKGPLIGGKTAGDQRRRTWRRHFGIAVRIAAGAFDTREDRLRMAADAIARGDYVACDIPEGGPAGEDEPDA